MRLFLVTSVLLAAGGSGGGASREIFRRAPECGWILLTTPYVIEEVVTNLPDLAAPAAADWTALRPNLTLMDDVLTLDRAAVFTPVKDRPILFSALAWPLTLLTLDRGDFGAWMGGAFYGLPILTPGMFLHREREAGRLRRQFGRAINEGVSFDRSGGVTAVVEPERTSALIGAIVMVDLDLIVDGTRQALVPRDPKRIVPELDVNA